MRKSSLAVSALLLGVGIAGVMTLPVNTANATAKESLVASNASDAFTIDGVHASAVYRIKHLNVSYFYGRFNKIEGSFQINKDKPETSTLDVTIDINSIDSNNAKRDGHLKSQDFFSAKEFPTATFKAKSFKKAGDASYDVTGDLTILGKTKSITVKVDDTGTGKGMQGGTVAGFETEFVIKRSDFGMNYLPQALGDDVTLYIACEGAKQ